MQMFYISFEELYRKQYNSVCTFSILFMKVEQVFINQNIRYLVPLFWCSLLKVGSPNCLLFCQAIISNILRVRTSFNKLFHYLFNVIHQFLFVVLIYNFLLFIKCSNFLKHLLISNNSIKRYFSNLIIVYYLKILECFVIRHQVFWRCSP